MEFKKYGDGIKIVIPDSTMTIQSVPWLPWISVKDQLPTTETGVLVYDQFGEVYFEYWEDGKFMRSGDCCHDDIEDKDITHWMYEADMPKPKELT